MPNPPAVSPNPVTIRDRDIVLLVGTIKGAFLFRSDHARRKWEVGGPYFAGRSVYAMAYDGRAGRHRIWAAPKSLHWGAELCASDDFGRTWSRPEVPRIAFPESSGASLANIWQIESGGDDEPDRLFLQHHFGLYRSDDGGDSWRERKNGVPSDFGFAMAIHPRDPATVYIVPLQSDEFRCPPEGKLRVYRTRDGARSWKPLARGLPQKDCYDTILRDALSVDREDPAGVYFGTRDGRLYASRDEGESWSLVAEDLPAVTFVRAATVRARAKARARVPAAKPGGAERRRRKKAA